MEIEAQAIVYAMVNDRRRAVCLKFTAQNGPVLKGLVDEGAFDFRAGRWVRLSADDRWHLHYKLLEPEPVRERDFQMALDMGNLHLSPLTVRPDKLRDCAAALHGWRKAREPEPQMGQGKALIKLLPHGTLIPIPWAVKGPQEMGWQNVPYELVDTAEYRDKLDGGNVGLLCGRDADAVAKGLVPDQTVVGLDADDDAFAALVCDYNSWLADTLAVEGNRGEKWFFAVKGANRKVLQSSKIIQRRAHGDVEVGDWLSTGKQGVIYGLHPSGKMYRHNGKPLKVIDPKGFCLPRSCYLASWQVRIPTASECYRRNYTRTEGPILDASRLQDVHQTGKGMQAACPACRQDGKDSAGDNLMVWPDGRFKCSAFIGLSAQENHEHNQRIYRLVGLDRRNDYE